MDARIIGFSLPPDLNFKDSTGKKRNTCPQAGPCAKVCYAKQGRYAMPTVKNARDESLKQAESPDFEQRVNKDLSEFKKRSKIIVRLHDSGDFYKQEYLDTWNRVAENHQDIIFYAYTKSHHLDFSKTPENMRIIQSLGGVRDDLVKEDRPICRIFTSHEEMNTAGYVDGGGEEGDLPAIRGDMRIGIVYHGPKGLTEENKKKLQLVQIGKRGSKK
jgi:hypothetical protein